MAVNEIWKDVAGYDGLYQVSSFGNVKNIKTGRILRPCVHRTGYISAMLYKNGKPKRHNIHRLVAIAFIENEHNYPCVNHIDENKANNCIENLEWCTADYNMKHGTMSDRLSKNRGHDSRRAGRKVVQMDTRGRVIKVWASISQASKETGTAKTSIQECCNGIHKTANQYIWTYTT